MEQSAWRKAKKLVSYEEYNFYIGFRLFDKLKSGDPMRAIEKEQMGSFFAMRFALSALLFSRLFLSLFLFGKKPCKKADQ